jgi:hypothetical protein
LWPEDCASLAIPLHGIIVMAAKAKSIIIFMAFIPLFGGTD